MNVIAINDILDGVSIALYNEFGSDYTIYPEHVIQKLTTPCFLIHVLETFEKRIGMNRYYKNVPLRVKFVNGDESYLKQDNDIGDRLFNCLETITLTNGEKLLGREMSFEYGDDGNLMFDVEYAFHVYKNLNTAMDNGMGNISLNPNVRGE